MLSDLGYDVWLGNARGNIYSRGHVNLTTSESDYWKFSFDQMGKYDIPAAVDKVLAEAKAKKLFYVGHSMGTTMFWVAMNERGEDGFGSKIKLMIGLGPVATVAHMESPIHYLVQYNPLIANSLVPKSICSLLAAASKIAQK